MENKKLKFSITLLNIILAVLIVVMDVIRCFLIADVIYNQIASAAVCVLALLNLLANIFFCKRKDFLVCLLIFLGVVIGSAGDFLIGVNFVLGAALFAVGHIFYIVALYFLTRFSWFEIIVALCVIAVSLFVVFVPYVNYGNYLIMIILYAIILSLMLSKCLKIISLGWQPLRLEIHSLFLSWQQLSSG